MIFSAKSPLQFDIIPYIFDKCNKRFDQKIKIIQDYINFILPFFVQLMYNKAVIIAISPKNIKERGKKL